MALKNQNLTFNERNCITIRKEEKETVKFFLELTELALKLLNLSFEEFQKEVKNLTNTENTKFEGYFMDILYWFHQKRIKEGKKDA